MRAAQREIEYFAPIYERYFPRIYAYCARRISDRHDAEDLTATVFTRALASLSRFRGGSVAAWLFQIAHHTIVNYYKQRRSSVFLSPDQHDTSPAPVETLIQSETEQYLRQLVDSLPARQRDILLMKIVGGLTAEEIATALGLRAGTVRVTLHRTLKALYGQIKDYAHDE